MDKILFLRLVQTSISGSDTSAFFFKKTKTPLTVSVKDGSIDPRCHLDSEERIFRAQRSTVILPAL
jgi:hypothetical protein